MTFKDYGGEILTSKSGRLGGLTEVRSDVLEMPRGQRWRQLTSGVAKLIGAC